MLLRGRRIQHWLFAAFSTCVAFWYVSQALHDLIADPSKGRFERAAAALTVLLPQFGVYLFHSITPLEKTPKRSRLAAIAGIVGLPMFAVALSPYPSASEPVKALVRGS